MHDTSALVLRRHVILAVDHDDVRTFAGDLARRGFTVTVTPSAEALMRAVADGSPDAVLLASGSTSGLPAAEAVRRLRDLSGVPCVVIAPPSEGIEERIDALEAGADEVLHVGIPPIEAVARIRAVLRRVGPPAGALAPWRLVRAGRRLLPPVGDEVRLTGAEFEFLALLAAAEGAPVDRETLSIEVFRRPWRTEDRAVDSLVRRLRRKLPLDAINSIRNVGYALAVPVEFTEARV
ncbi:response regulator transcription factor [Roseomonas eburnea]|uniref:Response regulator transcription factor n=1 Tax=Neoroseomonas eburnea TaxID=1346889 RepID=A0A9X9XDD1_9PROT|nr:winged helix-turn-helix domain-containing protein [Neoroseomonas eburnea]MBR0681717.1 response regulator transcription factor [Neoroseomonas eburnea]